jgi:hypothetical protein
MAFLKFTRVALAALAAVAALSALAPDARAQFQTFTETEETRWGATVYGGGDVDSLGNAQFGFRLNYRFLDLSSLARVSPEAGLEFRKNYLKASIGGRGDTRELLRLSGFGGGGFFRIQDFTNSGADEFGSAETWYAYAGVKFRMPNLGFVPLFGGLLGGIPVEGISLFAAEEFTGLDRPFSREGLDEDSVNEWYPYSLQFGFMIGSAGPWLGSGGRDGDGE